MNLLKLTLIGVEKPGPKPRSFNLILCSFYSKLTLLKGATSEILHVGLRG